MRRRAALCAAGILWAAASLPGSAAAQAFVAQPQQYLLTTDVFDGRSLWVQPASLRKRPEASIALMATADRLSGPLLLSQYGVTIASGGFGLGWQHDEQFGSTEHTDAWAAGYSFGGPRASIGGDRRWHRGSGTKDGAWDIGGRYRPGGPFELSAVWRDIGDPVILGDTIFSTVVAGAALQLFHARLQLGADWELVTRGWGTSAIRGGATIALPAGLAVNLRTDMDAKFNMRVFSAALTWNASVTRISAFSAFGRGSSIDHYGLWGSTVTNPNSPRRRFGG